MDRQKYIFIIFFTLFLSILISCGKKKDTDSSDQEKNDFDYMNTIPCEPNPCMELNKTQCTNDNGEPVCSCDHGFHDDGNGKCVIDKACRVNPCNEPNKNVCSDSDGNGVVECSCNKGYHAKSDGICIIDDACDSNPCTDPHKTVCADSNSDGVPECSCDHGFHNNGIGLCVIDDACDPNPCMEKFKTLCSDADKNGVAECHCTEGYHEDENKDCVRNDPCDPNPCSEPNKTICTENSGAHVCSCDNGYHDEGGNCVENTIPVGDIFISEYIEANGDNKAIELYNGTGVNLDLSNYQIWKSINGGTWLYSQVTLSGILETGSVYVIANAEVVGTIKTVTDIHDDIITFNGNDAVGLAKYDGAGNFELIDVVGVESDDPGRGWEVANIANATRNHTLIRKPGIEEGNTNWAISAGTNAFDSEWYVKPINYFKNIGKTSSEYDPCDPNPCSEENRTVCTRDSGFAKCSCDDGYYEDGDECKKEDNSPVVIINEIDGMNSPDSENDIVELLVISGGPVDMRGWRLIEDGESEEILFTENDFWKEIPNGTYIVIYTKNMVIIEEDVDLSDKSVKLGAGGDYLKGNIQINNKETFLLFKGEAREENALDGVNCGNMTVPDYGLTVPDVGSKFEGYFSNGTDFNNDNPSKWKIHGTKTRESQSRTG